MAIDKIDNLEITVQDGRDMIYDDHPEWQTVKKEIIGESRWSNIYSGVFRYILTDDYYIMEWSQGKTEQQDEQPFEYDEPVLTKAEVKKSTVISYTPIVGRISTKNSAAVKSEN